MIIITILPLLKKKQKKIKLNVKLLESDWFKRSGCGCGCGNLRMRVVAVSNGSKRFVRLVLRLEIDAFAEYL